MNRNRLLIALGMALVVIAPVSAEPLPGTQPLTTEGDLAAQMVAGIDKYLMRELAASVEKRKQLWKPDFSSPEAYAKSIQPNRERLKKILGVVDKRLPVTDLQVVASRKTKSLIGEFQGPNPSDGFTVHAVRWPVLEGVEAEGLLLEPKGRISRCVIALPDADWTPEMLAGLAPGVPEQAQFARRLADNGTRVLIPTLIDR